jgi:hypothetical protein
MRLSSAWRGATRPLLCAATILGCSQSQTVVQEPSAPPGDGPAAGTAGAFRLTSSLYRVTTRGSRGVDTSEIRLLRQGDVVTVVDTDDTKWPGEGRIEGNEFTLRAADKHGEVRMDGELKADNAMEGTIIFTPAGGGPVRKMSFTMEKIGPLTAPWSRRPSRAAP